jgi:hypothetical protein
MYEFVFRYIGAEVIICGGEKEEKPWRGARYLSTWDTTTEGGEVAVEMDQVYDQVALSNCGDLTRMRLAFPGVIMV